MNPASSEITHGSNNVFADLGFAPAEAENLKIRTDLILALKDPQRVTSSTSLTSEAS
jgi:hypothetical protein